MKRNFLHTDFEHFLKQNADQCRIIPSAGIWNNISKKMASKNSWLSITLCAALLFSSLLISSPTNQYTHPVKNNKLSVSTVKPYLKLTTPQGNATTVSFVQLSTNNRYVIQNNHNKNIATPLAMVFPNRAVSITEPVAVLKNSNNAFTYLDKPLTFFSSLKLTAAKPASELSGAVATIIKKGSTAKRKTSFQFVFTPTVSYRKLSDNKQPAATSNGYLSFSNANTIVSQKPSMGLELAMLGKRSISKNIKLFSGLQFNMSHYEVKAVNTMPEFATITLRSGSNYSYVNTVSSYRNSNANNADWLQNLYFQLSVPVGIEARLFGNKNTNIGIAGTMQPSYVIADQSYMLSTNYKNFVEAPWLVRRINVNTSLATFISYSSGKLSWQVGPQVRYQLLSSFKAKYPLKENLFDYGLRVGVSLKK